MDLSEKYVRYKTIFIRYEDNTREYFENQLKTITNTYNKLNSVWKVFQAEKKFTEENFNKMKKKIIGRIKFLPIIYINCNLYLKSKYL